MTVQVTMSFFTEDAEVANEITLAGLVTADESGGADKCDDEDEANVEPVADDEFCVK